MTRTLGELLREYEIEHGLGVFEAAAKVGVQPTVYRRWREGMVPQGLGLHRIWKGLGIPVSELRDAANESRRRRASRRATS